MKLTEEKLDLIVAKGMAFSLRYTIPLLVFSEGNINPQTATGIIIRTDKGPALATARHVIDGYLGLKDKGRIQIGAMAYVLKHLPSERINISENVDFGLIYLTDIDVHKIGWPVLEQEQISFKHPKKMDLIAYSGFPGCWKTAHDEEKVMGLGQFKCVGMVETVEDDQFSVRLDDMRYELEGKSSLDTSLFHPGGISGGPVFSLFDFWNSKMREPLLIGFISEGMAWDYLTQKHFAVNTKSVEALIKT
ncbi:hypothetical protein [Pseudoalteromonas galatheae]|uniref:hypothetical protein n=1 Tax=Pseudoalteromonas galatheae TaxID=579562 RepID=UPI0030CF5A7F